MTLEELLSHFRCKSELEYISINVDDNLAVQLSCCELSFEHDEYFNYEVKNWILDCADNTLSVDLLSNGLNDAVLTLEEAIQEAQRDYKERGSVFNQTIGDMIEYIAYNCKSYEYLQKDIENCFISKTYEEIYNKIKDYLS